MAEGNLEKTERIELTMPNYVPLDDWAPLAAYLQTQVSLSPDRIKAMAKAMVARFGRLMLEPLDALRVEALLAERGPGGLTAAQRGEIASLMAVCFGRPAQPALEPLNEEHVHKWAAWEINELQIKRSVITVGDQIDLIQRAVDRFGRSALEPFDESAVREWLGEHVRPDVFATDTDGNDNWYVSEEAYAQAARDFCARFGRPALEPLNVLGVAQIVGIADATVWERAKEIVARFGRPAQPQTVAVPTVLHCPECGLLHVDTDEWATTRLHRTHLCKPEDGGCGHEWRPYSVYTVGVRPVQPAVTREA